MKVSNRFLLSLGTAAIFAGSLAAQDIAITNVRIVAGNGPVIENGTIIVRSGKIVSAAAGAASTSGLKVINGKGMTAMPGYIDGHKHVAPGPNEKGQMESLLEAGFTTVLAGGGMAANNLKLSTDIESGMINGPHIIPSGAVPFRNSTPEKARQAVKDMAAMGIRYTGEIGLTPEPGPTPQEIEILKAVVDEANKDGVQVNVHAVSTAAMIGAIDAGVTRLVHMPNKDFVSREAAAKVASTHSIVLGLLAFGAPILDRYSGPPAQVQFPKDDNPRFRDGKAWPDAIAGANKDANGKATGTEAGFTIVNARTIWDATSGAGLGYGSDQNYADKVVLEHELKSYSIEFSMNDIIKCLTYNTAAFLHMENQIGSLEPGKVADITIVEGNPLDNIYPMLDTKVVLRSGKIVVDKRAGKK